MTQIAMFGQMKALPGKRTELLAVLGRLVEAVADEPGCEVYSFWAAADDPDLVLVFERYTDEAALATHFQNPGLKAVGASLGALFAEAPVLNKAELGVAK